MAAVSHPNIVVVHCIDDGFHPFLAMEYVEGESLAQFIARTGRLETAKIVELGMQIADGLAAAHQCGLTHRDIKPGNILLQSPTGRVKITDFGLARSADQAGVTRTGEIAGTPQYMSPEQAQSVEVDHRTDLFSLGSTLYAMSVGQPPFRAEIVVSLLRQVCDQPHAAVCDRNPDISRWLGDFIDRLLAKRPEDRFQSAAEVAQLLREYHLYLQQPEAVAAPSFQRVPIASKVTPSPRRRNTSLIAAVISLSLLFAGLEVIGITNVAGTIVRLVAGEGTLVIEVDDPSVQVSIEGEDVNLAWEGNDLKLRPGDYRVIANKDGKPIQRDVVTVFRNRERLFRVTLEGALPAVNANVRVAMDIPAATILTSPDWKWSEPMDLGKDVNSANHESRGVLTENELTMVLENNSQLWEVKRSAIDHVFGPRRSLEATVNGSLAKQRPWLSPDGLILTYSVSPEWASGGVIMCARRAALDMPFGEPVNTGVVGLWPTLTEDQCTMVFIQPDQPPPQPRAKRLMICRRPSVEAPFEKPVAFYPGGKHWAFNCPVLSPDGRLLLCSVLHIKGIWLTTRPDEKSQFGEPVALNLPLDSRGQKIGPTPCWISRDGRRLYITSPDRAEKGDLYQLTRVPAEHPSSKTRTN